MKPVAVIILNWNGASLLRRFLPSVLNGPNAARADVIVADNGSPDDSIAVLQSEFPDDKILEFNDNYGFAEGYNKALLATNYPYTVLLNSDVAVREGWLDALYNFMESHPDTGACQPKILSFSNPELFEYAGACGGFLDRNGYPYCRGRIFDVCESDTGQYDEPVNVFWATGAALMVRTELYLRLGGLDPKFFAHMEEIDLCWRILLDGYNIAAVPSAVVEHLGGGSLPAGNPRKTYLNFRNHLLMLLKNLPDSSRRATLFRRRLLDTIAWAKFMLTFDIKNANAVLRAHRDFRKMRSAYTIHPKCDLLATRHDTQRNILMDFFIRGKKKYSEL